MVKEHFSALKHVKNELCTTMVQSRMTALFLLCIENDIVEILQFDNAISSRRMPIL